MPNDSTYGFRLYEKAIFDALAVSGTRWDFFAEQTLKFCLSNAKIEIVESEYLAPTARSVRLNFLLDGLGYARVVFRASIHKIGLKWY